MSSKSVLTLALAAVVMPVFPQTQQPPVFTTAVTVVSLPVYVTDKEGQPVTGLSADDFEVTDDGRAVTVSGFQEVDAGSRPQAPTFTGAMSARRQFLFLFDLSFTNVAGLWRARQAAADFVKQLLPNDLGAVATFSTRGGAKLLLGFTTDRTQLRAAIERLGVADTERKPDPLMLTYDTQANAESAADTTDREERFQQELMSQQILLSRLGGQVYLQNVRGLLGSLGQLARVLNSVQGRKQVFYFSAGFDSSLLVGDATEQGEIQEMFVYGELAYIDSNRYGDATVRTGLDQVVKALASADVVVHTVDVTGLAAADDPRRAAGDIPVGAGRDALARLASGTGGRMVKNTNNLGQAVAEILDQTRRYYVVAFEPPTSRGPGRYHRLKVRVRAKGTHVAARPGYIEVDPAFQKTVMASNLQAGEMIVKGVAGGEIAVSAVAVPYRDPKGRVSLPVALEVEGKALIPDSGSGNVSLQVFGYALDDQGQIEDTVAVSASLDAAKLGSKLHSRGVQVQTVFAVSPGPHQLRFLVRDLATGRRGVRALEVTVPDFKPGSMVLAPPLFTDDPELWVVMRNPSQNGRGLDLPFRVDGSPFALRGRPRLVNGETGNVCVLLYDGGNQGSGGAPFEVKTQLLNADGQQVRMGRIQMMKSVTGTDGFRRFVLGVTPANVAAGSYSFKVKVKNPASGSQIESAELVSVQ